MRYQLLGPVTVCGADGPVRLGGPKQRAVLAALLLNANRVVSDEHIFALVWGDQPPASVRGQVHVHIHELRKVVGESVIVRRPPGYLIEVVPGELDLHAFDEAVAAARADAAAGKAHHAADRFRTALDLYVGAPLGGVTQPLLDREGPGLRERQMSALEEFFDAELAAGRHAHVLGRLRQTAATNPLRERLHATLMEALHRCGRTAEALAVYAAARRRLVSELGIEPGRLLQAAHVKILNGQYGGSPPSTPDLPTPVAAPPPRHLPASPAPFVGRTEALALLDGLIKPVDDSSRAPSVPTAAITGTAGVGKTTLAVYWAHQVADQFPDGQLYANLHGFDPTAAPTSASQAVRAFLDALGVPAAQVPATVEGQAGLYRSLLAGRRVLVVLDNARDAAQVRPLLPGTPGCLVLVTSRDQLTSLVAAEGARPIALGLLTRAEARELLSGRLGPDRVAVETHAIDQIVGATAQLPLALAVVAARATTSGQPLADLARGLLEAGGLDPFDGGDAVTDVRAVFSWSYRALDHPRARLFRLLGLHPGPDLAAPAAASLAGVPQSQVRTLLAALTRAHLLVEHTPGRYAFHDLLRAYATELADIHDPAEDRHAAVHRMLDHYLHTGHLAHQLLSPHHDPITLAPTRLGTVPQHLTNHQQAMAWFTANRPVLLAAVRQAAGAGLDTHAWQLAWTLLEFLDRQGHWHEQADTFRTALDAARRLADPTGQAHAHRGLGRAHGRLGRTDAAYDHLHQALCLYRDIGDRAGQARTHVNLGAILEQQNRRGEALGHDQQALALFQALGNLAGQARTLNNIGWYHAQEGHHANALVHCQQALDLHQRTGDHRGQANAWHTLGYAHHHAGNQPDAASCYQHALDLYRDVGDRYHEADTLTHLGDTQHAAGDRDAAERTWRHARLILTELGHRDVHQVDARLADGPQRIPPRLP